MSRPIVVITGTTQGIGRVCALELAQAGRTVVMLVRNIAAGVLVQREIEAVAAGADVRVIECDLASLASAREAARQVKHEVSHIDCLINNAGMVSMQRRTSVDGFELTFATNHLGPFLLTECLRTHIGVGGRIINVASRVHQKGRIDLDRVRADTHGVWRPGAAYARSKLANVLHTFALARRMAGTGVSVNCLHPGVVRTHLLPAWLRLVKPIISPEIIDAVAGARTTMHLALSDAGAHLHGAYLDEHQAVVPASALARDEGLQEALWAASLRWVRLD
jgi:NAD(P)-dependent dehydrogenase (short-subunit alcohol dehydrogenase family)